jgi:hypothetical protein
MKKKKVLTLTLLSFLTLSLSFQQITAKESNLRDNQALIIDAELKALEQFDLAKSYYSGNGVEQDYDAAAHTALHLMFFSCARSKPGIKLGYFVSLGKVFDKVFLGIVFTVFLNKLLHNTLSLRIFGNAPDVLNRLVITHYIPVLVDFRGVVQPKIRIHLA